MGVSIEQYRIAIGHFASVAQKQTCYYDASVWLIQMLIAHFLERAKNRSKKQKFTGIVFEEVVKSYPTNGFSSSRKKGRKDVLILLFCGLHSCKLTTP